MLRTLKRNYSWFTLLFWYYLQLVNGNGACPQGCDQNFQSTRPRFLRYVTEEHPENHLRRPPCVGYSSPESSKMLVIVNLQPRKSRRHHQKLPMWWDCTVHLINQGLWRAALMCYKAQIDLQMMHACVCVLWVWRGISSCIGLHIDFKHIKKLIISNRNRKNSGTRLCINPF